MSTKKDIAIQKVMDEFEKYANVTLEQLDLLKKVFQSDDLDSSKVIFKQIEKNEEFLDKFEVKSCALIENTIVLYNPMASDLRKLIACYRMVINMERIGDLVINIVHFLEKIKEPELFKKNVELIDDMLSLSTVMVNKSLLSFINNDRDLAVWTIKSDSVVDEINHSLMKKTIKKSGLPEDTQRLIISYFNLNSIVSNIERIADHATNIAEASIYSLEGKDIRHKGLEEE